MNFRFNKVILGILLVLLSWRLLPNAGNLPKAEEASTTPQGSLPRPAWLQTEPLVIVGNWDSMPIFRRRVGGNPTWQEEDYRKEHTEEAVKKLKELGVTMAVIHFYKGFGLEAEREHQQDAKDLAALCRKYGIRVGVYVGSTIAYETFLLEKPEAQEWFVPDYMGRPVYYDNQTFRKRAYFMHPGYREYMKQVLRIAVENLKADLIHFDNTSNQATAPIFFHPLAIEDFKNYLRNKFTPEMFKLRFGFSDLRYVLPPRYDRPLSTIDDPLFQEWTGFRCQQLTNYYKEMASFIRNLNPNVAVECNPHSGLSGLNTIWVQGVDYPRLLSHLDIVWTEEGDEATVTQEGVLVSKIRTYKMASTLKNKIFTYTSDSVLQMAEAMVYNRQCLGEVGGVLAGYELPEGQRKCLNFYIKNFEHYRDIDNIADVAVLESYPTMAFNSDRPYQSVYLFEQALIQSKIPFDIIFDVDLKDLSKYRVLVLADQECLSEKNLDHVRDFVRRGGGLVATELTSLYTELRQRKRDFGLKDLFRLEAPPFVRSTDFDRLLKSDPVRNQYEQGRVVYIPEIKPSVAKLPAEPMLSQYWKLPLNWEVLIDSVRWAARSKLFIEVKAPLTVTAEVTQRLHKNTVMVHLINYDVARNPLVKDIEVGLQLPKGRVLSQVLLLSPDEEKGQVLPFSLNGERLVFSVPQLKTYDLVVIASR